MNKIDGRTIPHLTNDSLEIRLVKWTKEMQKANIPIHDISIVNKAKAIQKMLQEKGERIELLVFSNGWVDSFKKRNGIRELRMVGQYHFVDPSISKEKIFIIYLIVFI